MESYYTPAMADLEADNFGVKTISADYLRANIQKKQIGLWDPHSDKMTVLDQFPRGLISLVKASSLKLATVTDWGANVICTSGVEIVDTESAAFLTEQSLRPNIGAGLLFSCIYMRETVNNVLDYPDKVVSALVDDSVLKREQPLDLLNSYKFLGFAKFYSSGRWMDLLTGLPQNQGYLVKGGIVLSIGAIIPHLA